MKSHHWAKAILIVGLLFVAYLAFVALSFHNKEIAAQRIQDVQTLTQAYREQLEERPNKPPLNGDVETLIRIVESKGVKLHNPIPIDPSKPCYRIVYTPVNSNQTVLIEETNVNDRRAIVRSSLDGSVYMQLRSNSK
jgi:hypothetical protein